MVELVMLVAECLSVRSHWLQQDSADILLYKSLLWSSQEWSSQGRSIEKITKGSPGTCSALHWQGCSHSLHYTLPGWLQGLTGMGDGLSQCNRIAWEYLWHGSFKTWLATKLHPPPICVSDSLFVWQLSWGGRSIGPVTERSLDWIPSQLGEKSVCDIEQGT